VAVLDLGFGSDLDDHSWGLSGVEYLSDEAKDLGGCLYPGANHFGERYSISPVERRPWRSLPPPIKNGPTLAI